MNKTWDQLNTERMELQEKLDQIRETKRLEKVQREIDRLKETIAKETNS